MIDIRIQVVNYKTKPFVQECLRSLEPTLSAGRLTYTLAVLDNASGDDLRDLGSVLPKHNVEIHHGTTNVGFGAGQNFLAQRGDARYLLLLNPDTRLMDVETLPRLVQRADAASAQVVGPRLVSADFHAQRWDHGELDGWMARTALRTGNSHWRTRTRPVSAAWIAGAACLVDKRWFDRLGGFDERFFLYKEDEDLCYRMRMAGGKVVYDPTISVFHHCGVVAKKSDHLRVSTDHFLEKHFKDRFGYSALRWINRLLH